MAQGQDYKGMWLWGMVKWGNGHVHGAHDTGCEGLAKQQGKDQDHQVEECRRRFIVDRTEA